MLQSDELERLARCAAGELDLEETTRVEAELEASAEARQALARLNALSALTREMSEEGTAGVESSEALIASAVARSHPRRRWPWMVAASAVAASVALLVWHGGPAGSFDNDAKLVVTTGLVRLHGLMLSAPAEQPLRPGDVVETFAEASATLADQDERALLAAGTRITVQRKGELWLERGSALLDGRKLLLSAGDVQVKIDGSAIISLEPFSALAQVTLAANRSTREAEPMNAPMTQQMTKWQNKLPTALAGATMAVWLLSGEALALEAGKPPVALGIGEVWSPASSRALAAGVPRGPRASTKELNPEAGRVALMAAVQAATPAQDGGLKKPIERLVITEGSSPTHGPATAPVTIVEFTDFVCPYCGEASDTLLELEQLYGSKLRFVYKQMPLPMHPQAKLAAMAALAAHEQGKFMEYRKRLFQPEASLERADLERYAQELGLDLPRFRAALDSGRFDAEFDADRHSVETPSTFGTMQFVQFGTPTFFINGRRLTGARPLEAFVAIIDEELAAQH